MARGAIAAAAVVLLCAAAVQAARFNIEEAEAGRALLQRTPNCTKIDAACTSCRNQRIAGTRRSELVCSNCAQGYRLRRAGTNAQKKCDCAPGFYRDASGACESCPVGSFCIGGDAKINPDDGADSCPTGLATTFAGAKSMAQCFTTPGYGRTSTRQPDGKVTLGAEQCPEGTYNVGQNTAGCQKCGAGLTTAAGGADALELCLAPAGSYLDKGIGKLCQKGTYSTALNDDPNCTPCPTGITTGTEGSDVADDCSLAMKGYYLANATQAELCPPNSYNDQEAAVSQCTPCPNGWKTKEAGATGVALCMAPPGWELVDGAQNITECPVGEYKADWNRNPCTPCGTGLVTAAAGSVSKDACLVPAGWGLVQLTPAMVAEECRLNTYGSSTPRVAASNARCTPCPADLYTDDKWGTASGLYTDETACKVQPGWGMTNTLPQVCAKGSFNAGKNRLPCQQCGTGYTTVDEGAELASQCVIQPGWKMAGDGIPAPCDKGSWSMGGAEGAPNATCTPCGTGLTTQEDESVAITDCKVCAPGYGDIDGSDTCQKCGYNTFAWGGASQTDECIPCATGSVSRRGASQSQQCYSELIDARNDVYNLEDSSKWTDNTAQTAVACSAACVADDTCVLYQFTGVSAATGTCKLLTADNAGTVKAGFKIGNADDYAVYQVSTKLGAFGTAVSGVTTESACLDACTDSTECEVFLFDTATPACFLAKSELEEDTVAMFHVQGSVLASDAP